MPKVNINNCEIYYELHGNPSKQETVVFLNGVMGSVNIWQEQRKILEKLGFSVLLHDFRGQLLSDQPEGPYSFELHARDLYELLKHLKIKKIHLLGMSFGGIVAQRFTRLYPRTVSSLTLLNTMGHIGARMKLGDTALLDRLTCTPKPQGGSYFLTLLSRVFSEDFLEANQAALLKRADMFDEYPDSYWYAQAEYCKIFINDEFDVKELKKIKCPVCIIASEKDKITHLEDSERMLKYITHAEFFILPKASHGVLSENPAPINSIILGFIQKNANGIR